jgi:prepilin signal peptidase PulO-like enzyme (type II secretory pathway)
MLAVAPRPLSAAAHTMRERTWASLGWGLLLIVVVPAVALALALVLVGLPAAAALMLAYVLGVFAGHPAAALALGERLGLRGSPYAQAILGVVLIAIVTNLPYVGLWLRFAITAIGFGAATLAFWSGRAPAAGPPAPAGPPAAGAPVVA